MTYEISDFVRRIKQANHTRNVLLDFLTILRACADPSQRQYVLSTIKKHEASQKIGYLFDVSSHVEGFSYARELADALYAPPKRSVSLVPHTTAESRYYELLGQEPVSSRWRVDARIYPQDLSQLIDLYAIHQDIGKRRAA